MLRELFVQQKHSLEKFIENLDFESVEALCQMIYECKGIVFLSGVGKSGIIASKIAATMISTGTRAMYLSPMDALHGDLGIVSAEDIFILMSKSGESDELFPLLPSLREKGAKLVALTSRKSSRLSQACDLSIDLPLDRELCPFDLAPTTSTALQLIFGDVLSMALMRKKNFTIDQYASNHPGGSLGKQMTLTVKDLMISGDNLPSCEGNEKLVDVLVELSKKCCGCVLVTDERRILKGIFTDGDLRRLIQKKGGEALQLTMLELMTANPRAIGSHHLAIDAAKMMEKDPKKPVMVLPVLDEENKLIGLVRMHDIIRSGL